MSGYTKLPSFLEIRDVGGRKVKVVKKVMTQEEARKIFPYRPYLQLVDVESHWGGSSSCNDKEILEAGLADRCNMCQAPTLKKNLQKGTCPDCDGRSIIEDGTDPFEG